MPLLVISTFLLSFFPCFSSKFTGPGPIQPCQGCGDFPVSLNLTNAYAHSDLTYNFRLTSALNKGCLELLIPKVFKVGNETERYRVMEEGKNWVVQVQERNYESETDYSYVVKNVTNPEPGNYGPFEIRTRSYCESGQIIDENTHFHFLAILSNAEQLSNSTVSVKGSTSPISINNDVTLTVSIPVTINSDVLLRLTIDPIWTLPPNLVCTFSCSYVGNGVIQVMEMVNEKGRVDVEIRNVVSPYYVPKTGESWVFISLRSLPNEMTQVSNEQEIYEYARGNQTFNVTILPGSIRMHDLSHPILMSTNLIPLEYLPSNTVLFLDLTVGLSHELPGLGHHVDIEMRDSWVPMSRFPDCSCYPSDICSCHLHPSNSHLLILSILRTATADTKLALRGLIDIQSSQLEVKSATSYNGNDCVIDKCENCWPVVVMQKQEFGLDFELLLTDLTGKRHFSEAGTKGVYAKFVILPENVTLVDENISQKVFVDLYLPKSFSLPLGCDKVYVKKHSVNFDPINNYLVTSLTPDLTTDPENPRNTVISVEITSILPIIYGMFTLMIPGVTLPTTSSNSHLAYESHITLRTPHRTIYIATYPILITPNSSLTLSIDYFCGGKLPIAPVEVNISTSYGQFLNGKNQNYDYFVEMEWPVSEFYGLGRKLGLENEPGIGFFASYQSDKDKEPRTEQLLVTNSTSKTTLTMQFNANDLVKSVVFILAIGENRGSFDIPVTVRAFHREKFNFLDKFVTFEKISMLNTQNLTGIPTNSDKIATKIENFGRNGIFTVKIPSELSSLNYIFFLFPKETNLGSVQLNLTSFFPFYFPFQSQNSILLLKFLPKTVLMEEINLKISDISFKPEISGNVSIITGVSREMGSKCEVLKEVREVFKAKLVSFDIESGREVVSQKVEIRGNLRITFVVENGLAQGVELRAKFENYWGLKYARCTLFSFATETECEIDSKNNALRMRFVKEVRDSPAGLKVLVSRIRLPRSLNSPTINLFKEVVFVYGETEEYPQPLSSGSNTIPFS